MRLFLYYILPFFCILLVAISLFSLRRARTSSEDQLLSTPMLLTVISITGALAFALILVLLNFLNLV